ncbi:Quinate transporter [Saitozyma sp. JCM 24511]|nr:Quinate transporter [Saitozyma sp. JCM 24511]
MGAFSIIEDRPTPKEVYNARIYIFAATCAMGATTFGYDAAFLGTTLARKSFKDHFGITTMTAVQQSATSGNITSAYLAAAFFGALFAWPLMETLGRKPTLQVASVIFLVGAVIMTAAESLLSMIYAGRVLTGFAVGALTAVIPSFIAEVSPPAIRGQLTGFFEIAYQVGNLVGFWINYGINQHISATSIASFRIPMAVQLIPGGMLALGSIFICESPALLLRRGKDELAMKNLMYLRRLPADHQYMREEVAMIRARMEEENALSGGQGGVVGYVKGGLRELKIKSIRHRVVVVSFMFFLQNFSGAVCINYYSPTLFAGIGISDTSLYTGVYGLLKAAGCIFFFAVIVDRSGRRIPWLVSASSCAACLLYLSIYTKIGHPQTGNISESTKQGGTAATVMIMLYAVFWSFGGNGLPWIISAEIFPIRLRSLTGAWAAMMQWLASYASTESFPSMIASPMGVWGTFLFFAFCCIATFIFTFIWIPETKGVPIECMELLFSGPVRHAAWRQKSIYPPHGMPPLPEALLVQAHGKDNLGGATYKEGEMQDEGVQVV